jgi:phosphoribosylaminoimidazolecarboxamide formyltransferase/IMP cyclohydrolase
MRALLSVSDRTGLLDFARGLHARGCELIATSGTAKALQEAGIPVRPIEEFTGAPEMLNGRVKTLHPKVHGALLARPERADDQADIARAQLELIDIAAINLYPFKQTISKPHTLAEAIENIDIGGPSMLRSAAKNAQRVLPLCDPGDYPAVLAALDAPGGVPGALRRALQAKAFQHTATYDSTIAEYLSRRVAEEAPSEEMPAVIPLVLERDRSLRYGENPHQKGALYRLPGKAAPSVVDAQVLQGKELSYNNILDAAAAVACLVDVPRKDRPAVVVIKHMIPCGVAIADTLPVAYQRARDADAVSAFGGIVALSHPVDAAVANLLSETFLEVIVAPAFLPEAQEILAKKKNLRLLALPAMSQPQVAEGVGRFELRSIPGGLLVQDRDIALASVSGARVTTRRAPDARELEDLALAWAVCKHVRSNAIVLAKNGTIVGVGPGQPNRVDSVRIAANRAGKELTQGAALASDAFFPFPDSMLVAADHGIRAIVEPGGSVKDADVIAAADERGLALLFTGERHFRH